MKLIKKLVLFLTLGFSGCEIIDGGLKNKTSLEATGLLNYDSGRHMEFKLNAGKDIILRGLPDEKLVSISLNLKTGQTRELSLPTDSLLRRNWTYIYLDNIVISAEKI